MIFLILSILFPIVAGTVLLLLKDNMKRTTLLTTVGLMLAMTAGFSIATMVMCCDLEVTVFHLTKALTIAFCPDHTGILFAFLATVVMTGAGFYSFTYMSKEHKEKRYFGWYLIVYGVLNGVCFAANLPTFYLFFEALTLSSMLLVFHHGSKEAIMAGLKYLFYSMCGAYLALFGFFFVAGNATDLTFQPGGFMVKALLMDKQPLFLVVVFCMILGFSVKGGMLPFHAWLPTAHPVAPAPASAVLSAMIVKSGILAIIRVVYFIFGDDFIRGTWVQTTWLILTLLTVFMGSMLAYREPVLKKRLAYSTVSQLSYILFGMAMLTPNALTGSFLHVLAHGFVKATLFLVAGAIIYQTGKTRVSELTGIGKQMPVTMVCYTIVSLGLIGIPPTGGFISKWWLATGALFGRIPVFSVLGPVILLISALLTAGYLLPLTIQGFLPGAEQADVKWEKKEPTLWMLMPIVIMTALSVLMGLFPHVITDFMQTTLQAVF